MEMANADIRLVKGSIDFNSRFQDAIHFFKQRSPVIFVSQHYNFWEKHGFVQQSLARVLTDAGVPVIWFDGADWRNRSFVRNWHSPLIKLTQMPAIPMRRLSVFDHLNAKIQSRFLRKVMAQNQQPFLWVQSGLDERVASQLPYIDVFSVFDDPYIHSPGGELSHKARLIVTQNEFAKKMFDKQHAHKTLVLYPPTEIENSTFVDSESFELPEGFPKKIMGYIGSFFSRGFDLVMFENFIKTLPDWGFILCGRTDEVGLSKMRTWEEYKNFVYVPWIPRAQVGAVWRKLNLNLMLYRPDPASHGAFPIKFLEALYYGVPSVATEVPKTTSLVGVVPQSVFPEQLKSLAIEQSQESSVPLKSLFDQFSSEMNPKLHLVRVAESLR